MQNETSFGEDARTTPDSPSVLPESFNRGIVVAAVYGTICLLAFAYPGRMGVGLGLPHVAHIAFGLAAFVVGAIAAFSVSTGLSGGTNLRKNALDTLVALLWIAVVVWGVNLAVPFVAPIELLILTAVLVGGGLLGSLVGRPVLTWMARIRIKGRQPFMFVNRTTAGITNEGVRFVTRVIIQSVVLAALLTIAFIAFVVFVAILLLWLAFLVIGLVAHMMEEGGSSVPTRDHGAERREEQRRREQEKRRREEQRRREQEKRRREEEARKAAAQKEANDKRMGVGKHYDKDGKYAGQVCDDGKAYNADGKYVGRSYEDGKHYDRDGKYDGRTHDDGKHYDSDGKYEGHTTKDGKTYNKDGKYIGKKDY